MLHVNRARSAPVPVVAGVSRQPGGSALRRLETVFRVRGVLPLLCVLFSVAAPILLTGDVARAACSESHQQEAELAYGTASEFLTAGRWIAAIPSLESAQSICPEHLKTIEALAMAYREAGTATKARADSLKTAGAVSVAAEVDARAQAFYEKSKAAYVRLIAQRGKEIEAEDLVGQGLTLVRMKDYPGARASFLKARALAPDDCQILFNLGMMHYSVQDFRGAVAVMEEGLQDCPDLADKIYPRLADAAKKAADKESKIGNTADAAQYNAKYQEYAKESGGGTTFSLAVQKMKTGLYEEAIVLWRQILAENPGKQAARLNLAKCLRARGEHEQAVAAYQQFVQTDPGNARALAELIEELTLLNRCTEAQTVAQEAVRQLTPRGQQHLGWIYYYWGDALECGGDFSAAKEKFRLASNSGDPEVLKVSSRKIEREDQLLEREKKQKEQAAGG